MANKIEKLPRYYGHGRENMVRFIPESATHILEVGCASGMFGEKIKARQQVFYWGIEPDIAAAEVAKTKLDKVTVGFFDHHFDAAEMKFDCVVFNDVLEHMEDPWGALKLACSLLKNGGVVVASIPNFLYWPSLKGIIFGKDWKYQDSGTLDRTHLRFFTRKSMIRMFNECGCEIANMEGINVYKSRLFKIANSLLLDGLSDYRYLQFAIVAKPFQR
jgi:2-polyprenyl-3-methyl-5-hydroxy-6-metoxy-1,4-benzoquinol methylase